MNTNTPTNNEKIKKSIDEISYAFDQELKAEIRKEVDSLLEKMENLEDKTSPFSKDKLAKYEEQQQNIQTLVNDASLQEKEINNPGINKTQGPGFLHYLSPRQWQNTGTFDKILFRFGFSLPLAIICILGTAMLGSAFMPAIPVVTPYLAIAFATILSVPTGGIPLLVLMGGLASLAIVSYGIACLREKHHIEWIQNASDSPDSATFITKADPLDIIQRNWSIMSVTYAISGLACTGACISLAINPALLLTLTAALSIPTGGIPIAAVIGFMAISAVFSFYQTYKVKQKAHSATEIQKHNHNRFTELQQHIQTIDKYEKDPNRTRHSRDSSSPENTGYSPLTVENLRQHNENTAPSRPSKVGAYLTENNGQKERAEDRRSQHENQTGQQPKKSKKSKNPKKKVKNLTSEQQHI